MTNSQIIERAEQIQKQRARRSEQRAVKKMLASRKRWGLVREDYHSPVEPDRCGQYFSCCYAQGRCEKPYGHYGPHVQDWWGQKVIYLKQSEGFYRDAHAFRQN